MNTPETRYSNYVKREVAWFFNIDPRGMLAKTRRQETLYPRQLYCWCMCQYTRMTLEAIGATLWEGYNHATVIHSCRAVERERNHSKNHILKLASEKMESRLMSYNEWCAENGFECTCDKCGSKLIAA